MQYYCIEFNTCGFFKWTLDPDDPDVKDLICPNCYNFLLKYPVGTTPDWINENLEFEESEESLE